MDKNQQFMNIPQQQPSFLSEPNSYSHTAQSADQYSQVSANEKKSTLSAQNQFERFLQSTSHIKALDLNLDLLKEFYQIKTKQLQTLDEIKSQYSKLMSRPPYGKSQKKNWSDQETNILIWIIVVACSWRKLDCRKIPDEIWDDIASMMIGRSGEQCKFKWLSLSKLNLQQIPWSQDEDLTLTQIIQVNYKQQEKPNKWSDIAKELNSRSGRNVYRAGKQCRERWNNHLDPSINRGPWSEKEDLELLKLINSKGKKWSDVSKSLKNSRTENSVKNRFNSLVKREKQCSSMEKLEGAMDDECSQSHIQKDEAYYIQQLIEKYENRIKNGLTLMHSDNLENINEEQDEEQEDENQSKNIEDDEDDDEDNIMQSRNLNMMNNNGNIEVQAQSQKKVNQKKKILMGLVENDMKVKSEDYNSQNMQGNNQQTLFPQFIPNQQELQTQGLQQCQQQQQQQQQMQMGMQNNGLLQNNQQQQQIMMQFTPEQQQQQQQQHQLQQFQPQQESPAYSFNNMQNISPQPFLTGMRMNNQNSAHPSGTQLEEDHATPGSQQMTPDSSKLMALQSNKLFQQCQLNLFQQIQQNKSQNSQSSQNSNPYFSNPSTPNQQNNNTYMNFKIKNQNDIKSEEELNKMQLVFVNYQTKEIYNLQPQFFQQMVDQMAEQKLQAYQQQMYSMSNLNNITNMGSINNLGNMNMNQQYVQQSPIMFQSKNQSMEPSPQIGNQNKISTPNNFMNFAYRNSNQSMSQFQNYYGQQTPPQHVQQRSFIFQESPQMNQNISSNLTNMVMNRYTDMNINQNQNQNNQNNAKGNSMQSFSPYMQSQPLNDNQHYQPVMILTNSEVSQQNQQQQNQQTQSGGLFENNNNNGMCQNNGFQQHDQYQQQQQQYFHQQYQQQQQKQQQVSQQQ